jgi:hypothetical protein
MNWNDPEARLALLEAVGIPEYNRRIEAWIKETILGAENGYPLRRIGTRWGALVSIESTTPQGRARK